MSTWALDQIQQQLPDALAQRYYDRSGAEWAVVRREAIVALAQAAKEKLGFKLFISIDAVDRLRLPEHTPRFEVVYFFFNLERNEHLRLKVLVPEDDCAVPTLRTVFQGANWAERLVWDFYGITFTGHGDLRRMLLYEEFKGHPLRKDYGLRDRQGLIPERPIKDIYRGPGSDGTTA